MHVAIVAASAPSHMHPDLAVVRDAALDHERPDVVLYDIGGMAEALAARFW
jgi:hypothetical protein